MTLPQPVSKYVFFLLSGLFSMVTLNRPAAASTALTFSPPILRFGEVVLGQIESLPLTVINSGSANFNISTISASGTGFSVSRPALPLSLAPGKSFILTVAFGPTASGSDNGSIVFNGSPLLTLRGSATTAKSLIPNPSSVYFGNVQAGNTSKVFVTLSNAKNGNITISNYATKGTGFSVEGLPLPLTLTPGQSFTFTIAFSPQSAGSVNGSFVGLNPKNYSNVSIPLSGIGTTAGQLSLSPSSVSFGNVTVGSTASKSGTLSAVGTSVTITSAGSSSSEFSLSGISLPTTIPAGQSVPYSVAFTPQSSGTASATVSFASTAATATESLTGSGVSVVQHSVSLHWSPSTSQVTGYNVYRGSTAGGPYAKLNSSPDANTVFTDSTVSSSHTYYYVTTAVNSSGVESSYSNQVQVAVP
jgi:Abnormal spindle-like microcephaly-assoc'd, ASPM-SPD-2-Hydin